MKIFSLLSCVSVVSAGFSDVAGELKVTSSGKQVVIQGDLTGLPKSMVGGGIHVHAGTDCTNSDNVGGHLFSSFFDGWLDTTYETDGDGFASINIKAEGYKLKAADNKPGEPALEDRCIVLHGASTDDTASRVAIGKIVKDGDKYSAIIKKYPGPNPLKTAPSGKLTVIAQGDSIRISGAVQNLGKNLADVGIHVHIGKDCAGGSDLTSKTAVNAVVGGHLLYRADGFLTTKYASNIAGLGTINMKTPVGAYTLFKKDATKGAPVEDHCIVIHSKTERVGTGKIVCEGDKCKAVMGPYPKKVVPISGDLTVSFTNGIVTIKGDVRGLPRGRKDAGIHVHTGEDCTNNGYNDALDIIGHIGGHLVSPSVDGWAFPKPVVYNTNAAGEGEINVQARNHVLEQSKDKPERPAVEGHCIVMHGASTNDMGARVVIGKIVKDGETFTAKMEKYPGPNDLTTVPTGTLTVTSPSLGIVALKGTIKGLGKNLQGAGIHIHTGTDCKGGADKNSKAAVNSVIGGHLLSKYDGFVDTTYNSNVNGEAAIYVTTPSNAYTLRKANAVADKIPAVEDRCIVIHDDAENSFDKVAIAQIKCAQSNGDCFAKVVPYPKPVGPISGELSVTYANGVVAIKGDLNGLFRDTADKVEMRKKAGIHVHSGTDCTDKDAVGGHLYSNSMDVWGPVTYDTNDKGEASIVITVKGHTLAKEKGTAAMPAVQDHCIVLHGASTSDMASRVAIGKIVKSGNSYSATLGRYPGPNSLTTPSGTINVTPNGDDGIQLASNNLKGLGKSLNKAGIHIHSGTDCTGGFKKPGKTSEAAVNKVVGGHLLSRGDGFKDTKYESSKLASGSIAISTPKGAYVLLTKNAIYQILPAVEGHCIVLHDADNKRVGVGKIVCDGSCKAKIGPYPTTSPTTTPKPTTTPTTSVGSSPNTPKPTTTPTTARDVVVDDKGSGAVAKMFVSLSAFLAYCFASF